MVVSVEPCALCGGPDPLQRSHIIPRFVFKWLVRTSSTRAIRMAGKPEHRRQDGNKHELLCSACEGIFSPSERAFAEQAFRPFHEGRLQRLDYDTWLLRFVVSVTYRVGIMDAARLNGEIPGTLDAVLAGLESCRSFLLGNAAVPRGTRHHLLFLPDIAVDASGQHKDLNWYFARTTDRTLLTFKGAPIAYWKLPGLVCFSTLTAARLPLPRASIVRPGRGTLDPRVQITDDELQGFVIGQSRGVGLVRDGLSARQEDKIGDRYRRDRDNWEEREWYRAAMADSIHRLGG
jgi:hypothetical protein